MDWSKGGEVSIIIVTLMHFLERGCVLLLLCWWVTNVVSKEPEPAKMLRGKSVLATQQAAEYKPEMRKPLLRQQNGFQQHRFVRVKGQEWNINPPPWWLPPPPGWSAPPPSVFSPFYSPYSVQQPGGMRPDMNDMPAYHPRPLPI